MWEPVACFCYAINKGVLDACSLMTYGSACNVWPLYLDVLHFVKPQYYETLCTLVLDTWNYLCSIPPWRAIISKHVIYLSTATTSKELHRPLLVGDGVWCCYVETAWKIFPGGKIYPLHAKVPGTVFARPWTQHACSRGLEVAAAAVGHDHASHG